MLTEVDTNQFSAVKLIASTSSPLTFPTYIQSQILFRLNKSSTRISDGTGISRNNTMKWRYLNVNTSYRCIMNSSAVSSWVLKNASINKRGTRRWNTDASLCIQLNLAYALSATCLLHYTRPKCDFRRWYAHSSYMHKSSQLVNTPLGSLIFLLSSHYKIMTILTN